MVAFERRVVTFLPGIQTGILLPTSQGFVISLLGNQWVSSLGLPVLDLRRMLLLLLL